MSRSAARYSTEDMPAFARAGAAIKALLVRLGALALCVLSLACWLALATFSINDPSLNTATAAPVTNAAGPAGAIAADLLLQGLGGGALLVPLAPLVWGWQALRRGTPRRTFFSAWLKFSAWIGGVAAMAGFAGGLPLTADWPFMVSMGGMAGAPLSGLFQAPFRLIGLPGAAGFAGALWLFASAWATGYAAGVRLWHLERGLESLFDLAERARDLAEALAARLSRGMERDGEDETSPLQASARVRAAENGEDEEEGDEEEDAPLVADPAMRAETSLNGAKRRIIRKREEKKKASRRETAEMQPEFPVFDAQDYKLPPLHLLAKPGAKDRVAVSDDALEANARMLETVLADFGVRGEIINVRPGPVVTLYELEPAAGVKSSRVINLADDIARSMSAVACRVAVVPGRNAIGIELPNLDRETVFFREMVSAPEFEHAKGALTLSLGKTIGGEPEFADLSRMPHLLIAGTTGSGKSVGINTMILSLLYRLPPDRCKMIMVDPKMLELSVYEGIPHLLAPVVTDPHKAVVALKWTVREMEERYRKMSKLGVRNISGYNERIREAEERGEPLSRTVHTGYDRETGEPVYETEDLDFETMPFIVVVIDEVADLMMVAGKDIEGMVQRLAQMARAAGIHLIMATQRPSVDVITGTIKANFPTRISFQVTSKIDSRTILGEQGAEQLLGQGDMLFMGSGGRLTRVHGAFVSDDEVEKVVAHLKKQGAPEYVQEVTEGSDEENEDWALGMSVGGNTSSGDALYDQALAIVVRDRKASTSYIQRRLSIGYNRAATLIEKLEQEGVISPANHAGKRDVLIGEDAA